MKLKRLFRRLGSLMSSLLGGCCPKRQRSSSSSLSSSSSSNALLRFSSSSSSSSSASSKKDKKDFSDLCGICLEPVAASGLQYALFERCDHRFCEPCGRALERRRFPNHCLIRCPTCRAPSDRMLASKHFLSGGEQKAALFGPDVYSVDYIARPEFILHPRMASPEGNNLTVEEAFRRDLYFAAYEDFDADSDYNRRYRDYRGRREDPPEDYIEDIFDYEEDDDDVDDDNEGGNSDYDSYEEDYDY